MMTFLWEDAMGDYIAVVGGMNVDIGGRPARRLVLKDSNPGRVSIRPGGVGRNIAHDLRLLGMEVRMLSAVGDDEHGDLLLRSCAACGIDTSLCLRAEGESSSTYLYITDEHGDMQLAVADMAVTARITPAVIAARLDALNAARAVVLDANLEAETLEYLAAHVTAPLCADPVSTGKSERMRRILPRLAFIKPNELEAEALTGEAEAEKAARVLLAAGVRRVFLSLGAQGMLAAEGEKRINLPCEQARVLNTTGAGDAVTAALVWAGVKGLDLERSLRFALRAGAVTCECLEANNPELSRLPEQFFNEE
jgi:pseudouridine kinase